MGARRAIADWWRREVSAINKKQATDEREQKRKLRVARAQKAKRDRVRDHLILIKTRQHEHFIALVLATDGYADWNLTDRNQLERAFNEWVRTKGTAVIDDSRDDEIRAEWAELKLELRSKVTAA